MIDFVGTDEEQRIASLVLAMMRTLKREEAEEKEQRKEVDEKWKEIERLGKYLHEIVHRYGQFNGKNVTKYLKSYLMGFPSTSWMLKWQ
ncbi:unnamed protein product [Calypogeia fissa]